MNRFRVSHPGMATLPAPPVFSSAVHIRSHRRMDLPLPVSAGDFVSCVGLTDGSAVLQVLSGPDLMVVAMRLGAREPFVALMLDLVAAGDATLLSRTLSASPVAAVHDATTTAWRLRRARIEPLAIAHGMAPGGAQQPRRARKAVR